MRIIKFRRGHATNSSSSHSIIIAGSYSGSNPRGNEYGWDWFSIEDEDGKLQYMGTQLKGMVTEYIPYDKDMGWAERAASQAVKDAEAVEKVHQLLGVKVSPDGYIDHQSVLGCPMLPDGSGPNLEFFVEFSKALARDKNIAIRGGNDNDDPCTCSRADRDEEDFYDSCKCLGTPVPVLRAKTLKEYDSGNMLHSGIIARKSNGVWVLYRGTDGSKIHLDLRGDSVVEPDDSYRPEFPELVDLKISNQCNAGCTFCYQDSTPDGGHAPTHRILTWMQSCQEQGVLELAIGGGEPTLHPDFQLILEEASKRFTNVAFTTKDTSWLKNKKLVKTIRNLDAVRAIGWSVSSAHDMEMVRDKFQNTFGKVTGSKSRPGREGYSRYVPHEGAPNLVFHVIPDAMKSQSVEAILKNATYSDVILLLGLKHTGRGDGFKSTRGAQAVFKYLGRKREKYEAQVVCSISIDTAFARQYQQELDALGVNRKLYYLEEGRFSLYYDAVENTYGPSSYEPDRLKPAVTTRGSNIPMPVKTMFERVGVLRV